MCTLKVGIERCAIGVQFIEKYNVSFGGDANVKVVAIWFQLHGISCLCPHQRKEDTQPIGYDFESDANCKHRLSLTFFAEYSVVNQQPVLRELTDNQLTVALAQIKALSEL